MQPALPLQTARQLVLNVRTFGTLQTPLAFGDGLVRGGRLRHFFFIAIKDLNCWTLTCGTRPTAALV
eukprot:4503561-Prymnesium_polylepis.1